MVAMMMMNQQNQQNQQMMMQQQALLAQSHAKSIWPDYRQQQQPTNDGYERNDERLAYQYRLPFLVWLSMCCGLHRCLLQQTNFGIDIQFTFGLFPAYTLRSVGHARTSKLTLVFILHDDRIFV